MKNAFHVHRKPQQKQTVQARRRPQAAGRRVSVLCSAAVLRTLNQLFRDLHQECP